jgi:hypothetical protein
MKKKNDCFFFLTLQDKKDLNLSQCSHKKVILGCNKKRLHPETIKKSLGAHKFFIVLLMDV